MSGGGPAGGATLPLGSLFAAGGCGVGFGNAVLGMAFGGGLVTGMPRLPIPEATTASRRRISLGLVHISAPLVKSRRSTMASAGTDHCVVTAKLRLW